MQSRQFIAVKGGFRRDCLYNRKAPKTKKKSSHRELLFLRAFGVLLCQGQNAYIGLVLTLLAERNRSVNEGKQRVVLTHTYILTGVVNRTTLADDDVAGLSELTAEQLDTESLALRLTAVLRTTYTLLVCHVFFSFLRFNLRNNLLHENLGQVLTVTVALLITSSTLLLEDQDLVVLQVLQDFALNRGAFYYRCTYFNLTVVVCEQDLVEANGRIYLALETVNIELATFLSLKLLTCDFYDNVH